MSADCLIRPLRKGVKIVIKYADTIVQSSFWRCFVSFVCSSVVLLIDEGHSLPVSFA